MLKKKKAKGRFIKKGIKQLSYQSCLGMWNVYPLKKLIENMGAKHVNAMQANSDGFI